MVNNGQAEPKPDVPAVNQLISARGPPDRTTRCYVVAIGASAGGLDACRKFLNALPDNCGIAFILVQHLDPTHDSMLVDLLVGSTSMTVTQAAEGVPVERDHLYIIPPGSYLSVEHGVLHLSKPQARHGARLPFDFLLSALAHDCASRMAAVVLSGTGSDGSAGARAVKAAGGLVIAQDPDEADYSGMPQSAVQTGAVDQVLQVADIPAAILRHAQQSDRRTDLRDATTPAQWLPGIIELLRARTAHNFTLYKTGTLQRRIERRAAMASIGGEDMDRYIRLLESDPHELDRLAEDLLINVTSFFRDQHVFAMLAAKIIPDLVRAHGQDTPLRIWIAGCSTGEETYSLAMLFREAITADKRDIKLQVFASDADPDAVAAAREGLYPETIAAQVSADRLARFFTEEDKQYRVSAALRSSVLFTVQDVLADPPFSRLDFVSCRNLLIYLQPEAQERVLALFHFALRQDGILLLGTAETVDANNDRFQVISKPERLYRHVGPGRPGEFGSIRGTITGLRVPQRPGQPHESRQAVLAELCRQLVMETYAPAAVLINSKHECLYTLGATDRYLRVVSGHPTLDLFAMARPAIRTKLRTAIQRAATRDARVVISGGRTGPESGSQPFSVAVQPAHSDGEDLLLVCFIDDPKPERAPGRPNTVRDASRVNELEQELESSRIELQDAIRHLEVSSEEQKAMHEEALSVQEEYQSTNEELLTSKEELQSLNEELTALNSQLQETLERQRITSNDLQNVLYSTDVATLFLDPALHIRFFTPATRSLFAIIPGDVGRPLSDLRSLTTTDGDLPKDAQAVLRTLEPIEREIETESGGCYLRRVLPYRTQDGVVEGVVITFSDITERRHVADELQLAKRQAEQANAAKSRFLAAASHDLRQPLQTLALVQGMLAKHVVSEKGRSLVTRLDRTLGAMSGMLNALLDINQIEAGTVHAERTNFPIGDLLEQLRDEFAYHAEAKGLVLRVVPCSLTVASDPRLLEQMVRNLVSNALKYTRRGKVLLGCRRRGSSLKLEVWDTGIGIPDDQRNAIFEEYHQVDNPARERERGLGLGLSIVQRLGTLLGHRVHVESRFGKGSVFTIDVPLSPDGAQPSPVRQPLDRNHTAANAAHQTGAILVVEDDPDVRELLTAFLQEDGHAVATALEGGAVLELIAAGATPPDIILTDYNLPGLMNGGEVVTRVRQALGRRLPAIILTGDITTMASGHIALQDVVQLTKPVKLRELTQAIQRLLPLAHKTAPAIKPMVGVTTGTADRPVIFVVDDDASIRESIRAVLEVDGRVVEDFVSCEAFLRAFHQGREGCLLLDACLPGMTGLTLLQRLQEEGHDLPTIMITGNSDVPTAVQAMKAGALDFLEKPISHDDLIASVVRALERSHDSSKLSAWRHDAAAHLAGLTHRQRQVMDMVLAGHPSKNIAADLGISQRAVENHRASIMRRTGTKSLPALARLALAAAENT